MEPLLGTTLPVFLGLTVGLFGGCAFMAGQGLASGWRPIGLVFVYSALLGLGDRFLTYGLFQGELWLLSGYLVDTAVLAVICLLAYRLTLTRRMVAQYPWLYERLGPFGWHEKSKRDG
ncbi:conserved membrane hypothetical protein [uncultured Gammaproteobacteria bacterium]